MSRPALLSLAFLGLHPDQCTDLLERFGSPEAVLRAAGRGSVGPDARRLVKSAAECAASLADLGVEFDIRGDPAFPLELAGLPDSPHWLFRRGAIPFGPAVAIVGTRRCTEYGRRLAFGFGAACARAGWTVVSGLARGIDGAAHLGAIDGGGFGVAVLGCGSDVVYPREHAGMLDMILQGAGAVVTEYPPGTPPQGWRFPPRNRIISGLARAVVIVESAVTGGSLGTAARALEQGRHVFAVPGDVDREASVGCNLLIRDGATPILGVDDLVEALSLVLGPPAGPTAVDDPAGR